MSTLDIGLIVLIAVVAIVGVVFFAKEAYK
jgi:hypothetical protein